ncbi:MAG: DinB family protein [Acidobacteriota bacterium]
MTLRRPDPKEHDPYYSLYTDKAPKGDILQAMEDEMGVTIDLLSDLRQEQETFRYAPGKWNLREVVGHLIDVEWCFTYRGLCFARTDPASRPGFDQDLWADTAKWGDRPLAEVLKVFGEVRRASLAMFRTFDDEEWARSGVANEVAFTVRSMPYILVGHEIHHRNVILERYLPTPEAS